MSKYSYAYWLRKNPYDYLHNCTCTQQYVIMVTQYFEISCPELPLLVKLWDLLAIFSLKDSTRIEH